MAKIFLSYRRQDSAGIAGRIYDRLRAHFGDDAVFMDIDSIPFGEDFRKQIDSAVGRCDLVLAVIGTKWAGESDANRRIDDPRDIVRIEIESALRREIPVIPILIDRTTMPTESDLPPSLAALTYRNAIDVDHGRDFHPHVDRLVRGIEFHFQRKQPTPPSSSDQPQDQAAELSVIKQVEISRTQGVYTADPQSRPTPAGETQADSPSITLTQGTRLHAYASAGKGLFRALFGTIWGKSESLIIRGLRAAIFLVGGFVLVITWAETAHKNALGPEFNVVLASALGCYVGGLYQIVWVVYIIIKRLLAKLR
jgi:hypothetical protein